MQIKGAEIPQEVMEKAKDCKTAENPEDKVRDLDPEELEKAAGGHRSVPDDIGPIGRV